MFILQIMRRAFEAKIHLLYQHCSFCGTICRFLRRTGQQSVQRRSSNFTYELRDEHKAEANSVVAVNRADVEAISRTTILPIVAPATTAQHTVRTCFRSRRIFYNAFVFTFIVIFFSIFVTVANGMINFIKFIV